MVARVGGCVLSEVLAEKEETGEHWVYNTVCSVMWEMRVKKMLGVKMGSVVNRCVLREVCTE